MQFTRIASSYQSLAWGTAAKANRADYKEEKQVWKAIVLIDIALITKTPAPRQKLFLIFFFFFCLGVALVSFLEKGKLVVLAEKAAVRDSPLVRQSGKRGLISFSPSTHHETSGKCLTPEKKTVL